MSLGTSPASTFEDHKVGSITSRPAHLERDSLGWSQLEATKVAGDVSWEDTALYRDWYQSTQQGTPDDFVILITASSKTPVSGTGKTTLLTSLGKRTDVTAGSLDAEWGADEKATMDAGTLAYDITPEVEPRSAVAFDEAQGTPGGTGLDSRRAMQQESIDAINSILANRDDQYTIIIAAQHTKFLDPRLFVMVDAWLMIKHAPDDPRGPLGVHHRIHMEDYDFGDPTIKTPAVEEFSWPKLPEDDPDYVAMEEMKQKAKQRRQADEDDDGELPKEAQKQVAQEFRNKGWSLQDIADSVETVTFSREWIRQNTVAADEEESA